MQRSEQAAAQLLSGLASIYLRVGQSTRALTLLLLATQISPDDPMMLRQLAEAFTSTGDGVSALKALDKMDKLGSQDDQPGVTLLRSRALLVAGQRMQARRVFAHYLDQRKAGSP